MDIDCSISGWCFVGFSSPSFIGVCLTNKNCIYLRCTRWRVDGCVHCKMTTATKLTYPSFHIVTFFFFWWRRNTWGLHFEQTWSMHVIISCPPHEVLTPHHVYHVPELIPLWLSICILWSVPPLFSSSWPLVTTKPSSLSMISTFCFLDVTLSEIMRYLSFPVSLQIISFRFIHVVWNVKISFLKAITFCVYVCLTFSWSIHPSVDGH